VQHGFDYRQIAVSDGLYIGATATWSPSLYKVFGKIHDKGTYEDLVLGFRAMLLESIAYVEEPLVLYRTNVGMSCIRDIPPFDLRAYSKKRRSDFIRHRATLGERLKDLKTYSELRELSHMQRAAVDKLFDVMAPAKTRIELEAEFHSAPKAFVGAFAGHPILVLRVIASELINLYWFLRKSVVSFFGLA
jgi:hypothetical protein